MTRRSFIERSAAGLATVLVFLPAHALTYGEAPDAVAQFRRSIADYVARVGMLERRLPPLQISRDPREIHRAVEARAAAIRRMRRHARTGDIFNRTAAELFRHRITEAAARWGYGPSDFAADAIDGGVPPAPAVNARFRWSGATPMPASVLAVLPELPGPLQYRFVGADLVLVDTDASVILDVLPHALGHGGT